MENTFDTNWPPCICNPDRTCAWHVEEAEMNVVSSIVRSAVRDLTAKETDILSRYLRKWGFREDAPIQIANASAKSARQQP